MAYLRGHILKTTRTICVRFCIGFPYITSYAYVMFPRNSVGGFFLHITFLMSPKKWKKKYFQKHKSNFFLPNISKTSRIAFFGFPIR